MSIGTTRTKGRCWRQTALNALLCILLAGASPHSFAEDAYQVKAAFIFNFTKFISWPEAMEQKGGELRLCIYNHNPFGDYIFQLDGRKIRNFFLRVQQIQTLDDVAACNILFLSETSAANRKALAALTTQPVLTISDQDDFAATGGSIQLLSEDNRIRFDVNLVQIKQHGLDISSKLLQLARKVY